MPEQTATPITPLRKARLRAGLSIAEVARSANVHPRTITRFERDSKPHTTPALHRIVLAIVTARMTNGHH